MSNEELLARIDERQKAMASQLEEILEQTKTINERVSDLEDWQAESRGHWKGIAAVSAVVGAIISYIIHLIK